MSTTTQTTEERLRSLLDKRTGTGHWGSWGMQLRASTCPEACAELTHSVVVADFYTERDGHPRTMDIDLCIDAVNALPKLLAVVAAARWYVGDPRWSLCRGCGASVKETHAPQCVALHEAFAALDEEGKR